MNYAKLQIGCMILSLYIIIAYVRETQEKTRYCNLFYDALLIVAPQALFFDGLTAWSVNHLTEIPAGLNLAFHGAFFVFENAVIVIDYLYFIDRTVGFKKKRSVFYSTIPGILATIGILVFLPKLYYIAGVKTNYSMGISVYICFGSLIIHHFLIVLLLIRYHNTIERVRIFDSLAYIVIVYIALAVEIIYPESLVSALLPTISLIVLYMAFENPSFRKLEDYNLEMVTGFATLVENRDDNTGGHIRRTGGYVKIILHQLKKDKKYRRYLTQDYAKRVINAAPMHDIGKIATPDYILQKPGKLTDDEYEIMKEHAPRGGEILLKTFEKLEEPKYLQIACEVATYHHEKWNGKGYPKGLKGEEIPLHARIMAVADVFDAVSAKRCYRDAMPLDKCFKIIEEGSGSDFDPDIVKAFFASREKIEKYYIQNIDGDN